MPHKGPGLLNLPWNQSEHRYCGGCSDISLLSMGLVLCSCSGAGFVPISVLRHGWARRLATLLSLMISSIVFAVEVCRFSYTCWGQMWCCAFYGMVSQLCCHLNVAIAIEIWCLDRSDLFSCWKHSQVSIKVTKVRICESMNCYWKPSKKILQISTCSRC